MAAGATRRQARARAAATPPPAAMGRRVTADDSFQSFLESHNLQDGRQVHGFAGITTTHQGLMERLSAGGPIAYAVTREGTAAVKMWKAEPQFRARSQASSLPALQADPRQASLAADTVVIEVTPDSGILQPSLAGDAGALSLAMRNLFVGPHGSCLVRGALPPPPPPAARADEPAPRAPSGGDVDAPPPPWFVRAHVRDPGVERWSVLPRYDAATGQLLSLHYTWEAEVEATSLEGVLGPGWEHSKPPPRERPPSIAAYLEQLQAAAHSPTTPPRCQQTTFVWSSDLSTLTEERVAVSGDALASFWGRQGGDAPPGGSSAAVEEVWWPEGAYLRAPRNLFAASGGNVVLEIGAVLRSGAVGRWVFEYSLEGDLRVKRVAHQLLQF